jgi:hypothetical protein
MTFAASLFKKFTHSHKLIASRLAGVDDTWKNIISPGGDSAMAKLIAFRPMNPEFCDLFGKLGW